MIHSKHLFCVYSIIVDFVNKLIEFLLQIRGVKTPASTKNTTPLNNEKHSPKAHQSKRCNISKLLERLK